MNTQPRPFAAAKASVPGSRRCNQDRCLVLADGDAILLGLADGLGGHPRGEVAAQLLVDVCETLFRHIPKPIFDPQHFLLQCIGKAHHAILRFGQRQQPPVAPRTTAVVAVVQGGTAHWAHVGDSRLYLIRDRQVLNQTRDHSQVRFVRQSADEAPRARASLTRCLGGMPQPPTTTCGPPTPLRAGDTLVLCSDGLWNQLPGQALIDALAGDAAEIDRHLQALVEQAATTPNSDNVTAAALRWLAETAVNTDEAGLLEPPPDPQLDRAIEHLHTMLKKSGQQDT
jgi:serine/threonine protein phosphatase PrpC